MGNQKKSKIKKYHQRAHKNPLALNKEGNTSNYTLHSNGGPELSKFDNLKNFPEILDIGCGFGKMSNYLSGNYPFKSVLGLEIRPMVLEYCKNKYTRSNLEFMELNTMLDLVRVIPKNSVELLFICFPDPHFKKKDNKKRIINMATISEYHYILKPNALLITVSDVLDLSDWNRRKLEESNLFNEEKDETIREEYFEVISNSDEADKVNRETNNFNVYLSIYRKI